MSYRLTSIACNEGSALQSWQRSLGRTPPRDLQSPHQQALVHLRSCCEFCEYALSTETATIRSAMDVCESPELAEITLPAQVPNTSDDGGKW